MLIAIAMMAATPIQSFPATSTVGPAVAEPRDRVEDEAPIRERASAWGAAFTRGDVGAIDSLLADDFIGTAKHGTLYDKPTMRDWVVTGPSLISSRTSVNRIRFFGDGERKRSRLAERPICSTDHQFNADGIRPLAR